MSGLRIYTQNYPYRTIALATSEYVLIFRHSLAGADVNTASHLKTTPRCLVEFAPLSSVDLKGYRVIGDGHGTLGLVTLDNEVFLCVVTGSSKAASIRPGETVLRIHSVDFFCLNHSKYDDRVDYELESSIAGQDPDHDFNFESKETNPDFPFLALKKLLSDGSFYYSCEFNLTDRLQDRSDETGIFDIESLDRDMLWNSYMIHPLLLFRNQLSSVEKQHLDSSQILTCVIRGYCGTLTVPASTQLLPGTRKTHLPSSLTIISRQSSRRAGTRFNSRGIDDDGHVANFVETETILWIPPDIVFSYVQVRGSVPIFWEQATGFLPGQQKIEITRSVEATKHAFDKHFRSLELDYGAIHVVNLLSELKSGEYSLTARFRNHLQNSPLNKHSSDHTLLQVTEFDFHAEARGPLGYGASSQIRQEIFDSLQGFAYFQSGEIGPVALYDKHHASRNAPVILQQEGVFRTNCLDCLDRTNLVQTIISSMALEIFFSQQGGTISPDLQLRHSTLWADNGDALSKMYAGTGALKSSFTRHGKMSIAGALADARKTATRIYVNNFADKARQNTIDLLLGRLTDQVPVHLYDPINDLVLEELSQRSEEFSYSRSVTVWTGTFNVNGRHEGPDGDLRAWLFPKYDSQAEDPLIYAVGFQEIVTLSPQQIMSTDPTTRKAWEIAVHTCLNKRAEAMGTPKYVLLRSGQLVGSALMIYAREDALSDIKNVEGNVKKTGLSGMAGNKGGCAIRFEYSNTRLCFVTAHLAAGFANYDERNRDYETILRGLRFLRNRSIEDHDAVIWLGDFNYRIGLSNQKARELVQEKDFQTLYDNDQLNLQMVAGRAFQFYTEGPISFPPTYKYNIGRNDYDNSEKARIPAWCDRILWRGTNLRQINYGSADLRISDHRPVWAVFTCIINVVDEARKSKIQQSLYKERQNNLRLGDMTTQVQKVDGELIAFDHIASELPPASSEQYKWWLNQGIPVKSQLAPPAKDYVLNIHRDSNPFLCDGPANWCPTPLLAESNSNTNAENPRLPPRTVSKSFLRNRDASTETWLTDDQCVFEQKRRDLDSPSVSIESPERGPNTNTKDLLGEAISDDLNWRPLTPE
ncbi:inositol polyphosphate 5-phosphatase [Aspergillus tubingensis]|uniref:SacI domain and endonuclease/exonuclease/phosphatase family protein n=1 Tax=Aspergillus tubingensis TaxID=5068 RepID=UPI0015799B64|nr:SacI domain and endonuclease/exonuclease/phosphatase family protein [Aspergillus tubingensis]GFN19313.1 SacI domain and endonuclease/exonuclease/phosphatase family protein [Aspergillus tubingensis]GLA76453.1 inositol polyphosphate 5-phosphatase [Aspergillus tubingensis]GLA91992.1 inositol polyphosphate 5-phosphatase [Aspergillus tubingensis]GLB14742.1 inositol polyphosphate 5-phosphatase [Aspergillus tubingensis]